MSVGQSIRDRTLERKSGLKSGVESIDTNRIRETVSLELSPGDVDKNCCKNGVNKVKREKGHGYQSHGDSCSMQETSKAPIEIRTHGELIIRR